MRALWPSSKTQRPEPSQAAQSCLFDSKPVATGEPLLVPIDRIAEDPNNPRTDFPQAELDELADDIRQHGILQPIVVHPADSQGCYRIHFGAKRLRAAQQAGLHEIPVTVRIAEADPYTQVAENQKRHGLTPLDLARFIQGRSNTGDSNATIAKRLGMNLTTVAHHLALLNLPPELDEAMKSGRCTSLRTLHELSKLKEEQPERVKALLTSDAEITRNTVAELRTTPAPSSEAMPRPTRTTSLIAQANTSCKRLEQLLDRFKSAGGSVPDADLAALRRRLADLANRLP